MYKKTSKNSIRLMFAVILLAVCMGMTATYAAFATSSTSTGTVSFSGDFEVTATLNSNSAGTVTGSNGTYTLPALAATVNLNNGAVSFTGDNTKLKSVLVTNSSGVSYFYKVTLALNIGTNTSGVITGKTTGQVNSAAATSGASNSDLSIIWKNTSAITGNLTVTLASLLTNLTIDKTKLNTSGGSVANMTATLTIQTQIGSAF